MRCEPCQELLHDHLYGLLDAAEAEGVEAHLSGCLACAAARDRARHDQQLFASAAKVTFSQVRFEAPREPVVPPPAIAPSVEPARPTPDPSRGRWATRVGWALTASVAFGLLPAAWFGRQSLLTETQSATNAAASAVAGRDAVRAELAAVEAHKKTEALAAGNAGVVAAVTEPALAPSPAVIAATKERDDLLAAWFEEAKQFVLAEKKRKLGVLVSGPAAVQPGAPNDFTVVLQDRQGTPGTRHVEAQVRDDKEHVLFRQTLDHERKGDRHTLRLPPQMWNGVKPESDLFLVVATVDPKTGLRTEVQDRFRLLGPVYTTLLTTDKPLYRPGERVFFRSLTLDRASFRPPEREQELRFDLRGPNGTPVPGATLVGRTELVRPTAADKVEPVLGPDGKPLRGVGTGAFDLPPNLAAGDYTLTVSEVRHPAGYRPAPPAHRRVAVRPYGKDRFQKKLELAGASFSGGDTVAAWCDVRDLEKAVAGATVEPQVLVDGRVLPLPALQTDANGRAAFTFQLPTNLDAGDVQLRAVVRAGDVSESRTTRIPVVGRHIKVEFFPEGGYLVAGVPCRVYLRATTPLGEPADIRGLVTDGREVVARIETFTDAEHPGANRGLGAFTFTPKVGTAYRLKLEHPAGIHEPMLGGPVPPVPAAVVGSAVVAASRTGFALPEIKPDGVVMSVVEGVSAPGRPITVQLWSVGRPRNLVVGAYTRGRLMDTRKIAVAPSRPEVVTLAGDVNPRGGVTRVTVFEEPPAAGKSADLVPVAERLVYRKPTEELKLAFDLASAAGGTGAMPAAGGDARLTVRATDEKGQPAAAVLYAAVVDANAAAQADGKRDRLLTTHFLLAGEVQHPDDLEHVDFLLTDGPKAAQALDLLLGTQGWRRFAEQDSNPMRRKHAVPSPDLDRLVMLNGQYLTPGETFLERERRRAHETYWPKFEAAARRVEVAAKHIEAPSPRPAANSYRVETLHATLDEREAEATERKTAARLTNEKRQSWLRAGAWAAGAFGALLLLTASLVRGAWGRRLPFALGGILAGGLAWFLVASPLPSVPDEAEQAIAEQVARSTTATTTPPAAALTDGAAVVKQYDENQRRDAEAPAKRQAGVEADRADRSKTEPKAASAVLASEDPAKDKKSATPPPAATFKGAMRPNAVLVPALPAAPGFSPATSPDVPKPATGPGPLAMRLAPSAQQVPNGTVGGMAVPAPMAKMGPMAKSRARVPGAEGVGPLGGIGNKPPGGAKLMAARAQPLAADATRGLRDLDESPPDRPTAAKKNVNEFQRRQTESEKEALRNRSLDRLKDQMAEDARKFVPPPALPSVLAFKASEGKQEEASAYFRLVRDTVPRVPPLIVREYAGIPSAWNFADDESATSDTVLWQPAIVLPGEGTTNLSLRLNPNAMGYRVIVAGHTLDGRLGAVRGLVPVTPAKPIPTK